MNQLPLLIRIFKWLYVALCASIIYLYVQDSIDVIEQPSQHQVISHQLASASGVLFQNIVWIVYFTGALILTFLPVRHKPRWGAGLIIGYTIYILFLREYIYSIC